VVADLLDDGVIKMAGVAEEAVANLQGVFEATESIDDIANQRDLATFPELHALVLTNAMDLLDP
jgi:hypothetical protein